MKKSKATNSRLLAITVLQTVIYQGQSLDRTLDNASLPPQEASFIRALCFGVIRYYYQLIAIAKQLLSKPLKDKDQDIYLLLLSGFYQLLYMRTPAHAVVSETVNATRILGKTWASGLVNAVLRNFQRHQPQLLVKLEQEPNAFYAHPQWFVDAVKKAWPAHWQAILEANNQQPPMSLRVNISKLSREDYLAKLQALDIYAQAIPYTSSGLFLNQPVPVEQLPGFKEGEVSVQDGAAQFAAELLELEAGLRVLDACAAPGGKTCQILELEPQLQELLALDVDAERLKRVSENLKRLQLNATLRAADASQVKLWWDGKPFDRILLDAPCSGTGVIRRHPDIKLLRRQTDFFKLAEQQLKLLTTLWETLQPGGILLYITCSIMPDENMQVIEQFLAAHSDAQEKRIDSAWGLPLNIGRQILPSTNGMDGFYYARLQKLAL